MELAPEEQVPFLLIPRRTGLSKNCNRDTEAQYPGSFI